MFKKSTIVYILQFRIYICISQFEKNCKISPKINVGKKCNPHFHEMIQGWKGNENEKCEYWLNGKCETIDKKIHIDRYFISFYLNFHIWLWKLIIAYSSQ